MLRTKSLISTITDVPREWVFEYYLKLGEKLVGQDVNMKSIFNPKDKKPSMFVYFHKTLKSYRFKDFSRPEIGGDGVSLVKEMFKMSTRGEAAHKIIEDYNQYVLTNEKEDYNLREFKVYSKYKVQDYIKREWTVEDQKFWTRFHIGSRILNSYNVFPIESYRMTKIEGGETKELIIKGNHIYGYFKADGTLYKIYQPYVKDNKFIKVKDYIQGIEQLTYTVPYLVICSSLKDLMAFRKLGFNNAEAIAPDSENVLIPENVIAGLKTKYKAICSMLDNDDAGKIAMDKYNTRYNIPGALLELEKDLSDAVKEHGPHKVRELVAPLLKSKLIQEKVL